MSHKGGLIPALGKQAGRALVAMILVFYTAALLGIIVQGCRVQIQVNTLRQENEALKKERDALVERAKEAQNDSNAERIAREELKMNRPGEQVFAPVQATGAPVLPPTAPTPSDGAQPSLPARWIGWIKQWLGIGGQ